MSGTSILRRAGAHINEISPKRRMVPLMVAGVIAGALFGGHQDAAFAQVNVPAHTVTVTCGIGRLDVDGAIAYGTVPNPPGETVRWYGYLQRWNGSAWVNVRSHVGDFRTSNAARYGEFPGGLILEYAPHWDNLTGGYYRVVSRFYWFHTGVYSPWESSAWPAGAPYCYIPGFVIVG
jgi:hypothetical protein